MAKTNRRYLFIVFLSSLVLLSCMREIIMVGTARTPIDPGAVMIYYEPPAKYERIGHFRVESSTEFARRNNVELALAEGKRRAAKVGANGLLVIDIQEKDYTSEYIIYNTVYAEQYTLYTVYFEAIYVDSAEYF